MNLMKRFLVEGGTRGGVGASREIEALIRVLLLAILNPLTGFWPTSSFCSLVRLAEGFTKGLHHERDLEAIAIEI